MKKLQYTTNQPSASTDYLAADNTWKTIPGGGGGGVPYTGATADVDLGTHSLTADTIGIGTPAGAEKLHIDGGASTTRVKIDADNGVSRILSFRTDDVQRWALRVDGTESGSNSGADFQIRRYNDAGAHIDNPIAINRANGNITTSQNVNGASPTEMGHLSGVTSGIQTQINSKQSTLISGTNIKTINGDSIIGSGNELVFNYDRANYGFEGFSDFNSPATANNAIDPAYTVFVGGAGAATIINALPSVRATNQQGFIQPATGTTNTGNAGIFGTTSGNNFMALGGGPVSFVTSTLIPTLSTSLERYRITIGFGTSAINASDPTGIFFTYDEGGIQNGTSGSPNWQCITAVSSVRTLTVTSVAASTTAWQKFSIEINAASTSVEFYIDNVLVATHTTNVPTGISQLVTPKIQIAKSIGTTSRSFFADYFGYKQTYTTPRI